ncbi:MAG: trigger factor [Cellulosilyticum sp.]|nr:trigger factor [Cellulosilyticum sp.]
MNAQVEVMENSQVKLTVEIDGAQVAKAVDAAYESMKKDFNVQGFRKGRVPRAMIEKMYGVEVFYNKAADILIDETLFEAIEANKVEIAARIRPNELEVVEMNKDGMKYTAIITVKPEVTLGDYKNLKVEAEKVEVTDEEVEEAVNAEAAKNAREISVEDRAVMPQDKVTIDFEGFIDGEAFQGGKGTDYDLVIGSKSFIDNFEDQLIGKNIGEEVEVNVTFPAEYHAKELANKPAMFKVAIKAIKVSEVPEVNDDFAADVSEFDTLAEYKADLKAKLLKDKEVNSKNVADQQAVEDAIANATIVVPEAMVEEQVERNIKNFENRMKSQGLELAQYLQFVGQDMETFKANFTQDAEHQIKSRLVLEKIAEVENIEVTDEDIDAELKQIADMYRMPFEDLKKSFGGYEKESLAADIKVQKAAKVITESAEVVVK